MRADHHGVCEFLGCELEVWNGGKLADSADEVEVDADGLVGDELLDEIEASNLDFAISGQIDVLGRQV